MKRLTSIITATALAATFAFGAAQPAKADQTTTDDIILGAAALAAGIATYTNVQHKNQLATTVQGYTPWGATVYEDGHVVLPNGQSYYPGNVGQQIACNGTTCQIYQNGVAVGYGGYGPGYGGYNAGYYPPANNVYYPPANTGYYGPYSSARQAAVPATYRVSHPAVVPAGVASDRTYASAQRWSERSSERRVQNERGNSDRNRDRSERERNDRD